MPFEDTGVADLSMSIYVDTHVYGQSSHVALLNTIDQVLYLRRVKLESTTLNFIPAHLLAPASRSS